MSLRVLGLVLVCSFLFVTGEAAIAGTLGRAGNCREKAAAYTSHEGLQDWQALGV